MIIININGLRTHNGHQPFCLSHGVSFTATMYSRKSGVLLFGEVLFVDREPINAEDRYAVVVVVQVLFL